MSNKLKLGLGLALSAFLTACATYHPHDETHHHDGNAAHSHAEYPNIIRRMADFKTVNQPFVPTKKMLGSKENASGILFYETILAPRSPGAPPHIHENDEEFFYVVSGTLDAMSGEDVVRLEAGDFAALLPGTAHMFWNGSDEETKIIMAVAGGEFEEFFDTVGAELAAARPATFADAQPIIVAHASKHGTYIDMSLMPEEAAPFYKPPEE